jgi:hypothetical protein
MDLLCRLCSATKCTSLFAKSSRSQTGHVSECKACRSALSKAHYAANRDAYKKKRAAWWQNNKEALRGARTAYRLAHPEMFSEGSRKWREGNPEKALAVARKSQAKLRALKPDVYARYSAKSYSKHRDANLIGVHKWRSGGGDLTVKQWLYVKSLCGHRCVRCGVAESEIKSIYPGRSDSLEMDHILPISRGGGTTVANIQPLCPACNNWKRRKALDFRPESAKEELLKAA